MLSNLNEIANVLKHEYEKNYHHVDLKIPKKCKDKYSALLSSGNNSLGYASVEFFDYSLQVNTSSGKKISIPNFWFFAASFFVPFLQELKKYKAIYEDITKKNGLDRDWATLAKKNGDFPLSDAQLASDGFSTDEMLFFKNFMTDYNWWGGGKTIDRGDYYISPILKLGNFLAESQSAISEICWQLSELEDDEIINELNTAYINSTSEQVMSNRVFDFSHDNKLSKPFLLLAGISGTGKTRFVRQQALSSSCNNSLEETYCLVSVRPDWHEPSDLLGYTSRLSGDTNYVTTEVLQFLVKAWQEIEEAGVNLKGRDFSGHETQLKKIRPFWLCLDEMNLAPVEQYFADYLSVLETREWNWENEKFVYSSDPLLTSNVIKNLSPDGQKKLCSDLGLSENDELWEKFRSFGIGIPFNLIVAGTVNMDETTHGFSRKVIDRALSFDFGEFFPNNYDEYFKAKSEPITFSYPIWSNAQEPKDLLSTIDSDGAKSIAFLKSVNTVLDNSPFELAFRALNELLLSVVSNQPQTKQDLQAVWDDFLMCKVLPRIEGDASKLASGKNDKTSILDELLNTLNTQLAGIITGEIRPDLCRQKLDSEDKTIFIGCRSLAKLMWMKNRLGLGFTSFWP